VPHLFGVARADPISSAPRAALLVARKGAQVCISREFTVWATGRSSPIVSWLRGLAAAEHNRCGGPGVGAVGMCYTGGFALAMATDERLIAPVLSQPG
jgi:dienelactone hydrolase